MKAEINNKIKNKSYSNTWRLSNMILEEKWVAEDIKDQLKKILRGK